jgi:ketosteroid isomerase-like protein
MKTLLSLFALLLPAHALAADAAVDVAAALQSFTDAVAAGDAAAARAWLHPDSVQVVMTGSGPMTLGTDAYLSLIEQGKVGGQPIALSLGEVQVNGAVAAVTATRRSGALQLQDAVTLCRDEVGWKIVGMAVQASPL